MAHPLAQPQPVPPSLQPTPASPPTGWAAVPQERQYELIVTLATMLIKQLPGRLRLQEGWPDE